MALFIKKIIIRKFRMKKLINIMKIYLFIINIFVNKLKKFYFKI